MREDKPRVFYFKQSWAVSPKGAAYCLLFDTWVEALEFALRKDFYAEYGRRILA